ncbi:MAG: hypothetical protein D6823_03950 [Chloroflexi bacterium]|nr:MAG: hypothetical protein D6823_03950 [Chloroflexota bacterium]
MGATRPTTPDASARGFATTVSASSARPAISSAAAALVARQLRSRRRNVIEHTVGFLKDCRSLAIRFEKHTLHFLNMVNLAIIQRYRVCWPRTNRPELSCRTDHRTHHIAGVSIHMIILCG